MMNVALLSPTPPQLVSIMPLRLETVECEILQEAAARGAEALGLASSVSLSGEEQLQRNAVDARPDKTSPHTGNMALRGSPSSDSPAGLSRTAAPADEDRDVRELENMLMGLEGKQWASEANCDDIPIVEMTVEGAGGTREQEENCGGDQAPLLVGASGSQVRKGNSSELGGGVGTAVVAAAGELDAPTTAEPTGQEISIADGSGENVELGGGVSPRSRDPSGVDGSANREDTGLEEIALQGRSHSPLAFTIEEDGDDDPIQGRGDNAHLAPRDVVQDGSGADAESTRELLGSIADTLTPSADIDSHPLLVTKSELALVSLMEEAGEESGELLGAGSRAHESPRPGGDDSAGVAFFSGGERHGRQAPGRGNSGFDDALFAGCTAFGSSAEDGGGRSRAGLNHGVLRPHPQGVNPGAAGSASPGKGARSERRSLASPPEGTATHGADTPARAATAAVHAAHKELIVEAGAAASEGQGASVACAPAAPAFSLGHQRWATCGFTSGHDAGKGGRKASVARALGEASSVLALDNMNYFLAR